MINIYSKIKIKRIMTFYVSLQSYCMCTDTGSPINIKPFLCKQHPDIVAAAEPK